MSHESEYEGCIGKVYTCYIGTIHYLPVIGKVQTSYMLMLGLPPVHTTIFPTVLHLCRHCLPQGCKGKLYFREQMVVPNLTYVTANSLGTRNHRGTATQY